MFFHHLWHPRPAGALFTIAAIAAITLSAAAVPGAGDASKTVVIKAGRIHTITGDPIENGVIVVRNGKIVSVGPQASAQVSPPDALVIELPNSVVTPGLIDAHAAVASGLRTGRPADRPRRRAVASGLRTGRPADRPRRRNFWSELAAWNQFSTGAPGPRTAREMWNRFPTGASGSDHDHAYDGSVCPICSVDPARAALVCPQRALHELTMTTGCPICGYPDNLLTRRSARAPYRTSRRSARAPYRMSLGVPANQTWSENSSEITPQLKVSDTLDLSSNDFDRLLRGGVTTVWVSPDSGNVIGMRGAIVKTAGPRSGRILREAGAVKAAMGRDPVTRGGFNRAPRPERFGGVTFSTRRPTTRMGVHWVFRKAFYDAMRYSQGLPIHGADMPPIDAIPILMKVLRGEIPLRIQARAQHDILLAITLAREFGLGESGRVPFVLEEATESYQCLAQLKAARVPVVFGPIFSQPSGFRARASGEADDPRLNTAKRLIDAGITTAITAHEMRDEEGLVRQAMVAVRYGLSRDAALRAITRTPAEIMNLQDRVGTLSPGADADLVIWSGEPLDAASRALLVMIDGRVVYRAEN